jgi:hypothetical protein
VIVVVVIVVVVVVVVVSSSSSGRVAVATFLGPVAVDLFLISAAPFLVAHRARKGYYCDYDNHFYDYYYDYYYDCKYYDYEYYYSLVSLLLPLRRLLIVLLLNCTTTTANPRLLPLPQSTVWHALTFGRIVGLVQVVVV